MGEPAGGLRFAEKPFSQPLHFVRGCLIGELDGLDRDVPRDAGIVGAVDDSHGPAA